MARFTKAYSTLVERLGEVDELRKLASGYQKLPTKATDRAKVNALGRAGVVLLCSHVEGYIEDLGKLAIDRIQARHVKKDRLPPRFRYHISRDHIEQMYTSKDPDKIAEAVLRFMDEAGSIWDATERFSQIDTERFFRTFSSPKHDNIRAFFGRFGFEGFDGKMKRRLTTRSTSCINMVNNVVHQRNAIAHGDRRVILSSADLRQMSIDVKLYCRTTDEVVGDWFRDEVCPIR